MTFATFGLHPDILRGVHDLGFVEPTPIQRDAVPPALAGEDLLACAMTGSGKTAAFVLPTLHRLLLRPKARASRVLILTPTRELAAQVASDLRDLASHVRINVTAIYGGVGMGPQEQAFRRGVEVLVATPGRLLDHLQRPYARLDAIEILVLDEADRMLDMGFLPDIRRILRHVPARRQTLFFSATMPPPIAKLAAEMLHNPVKIATERPAAPAIGVRHRVFPVSQADKSHLLLEVLGRDGVRTVLVFTRTKSRANRLANFLSKNGIDAARIHGDRSQAQREKALAAFKNGRVRILVATDIAARGIDIEELSHVVNFDVPHVAEDYIHRVGRTARASRTGDAFTFVSPEEESDLRSIEKSLGRRLDREVPVRKSAVQVPRAAHQAARHARPAMAPSTGTWQHRTGAARTHRNDHRERAGTRPPRSTAESRIHHGGRHEDGRRTRDARARRVPERRRR